MKAKNTSWRIKAREYEKVARAGITREMLQTAIRTERNKCVQDICSACSTGHASYDPLQEAWTHADGSRCSAEAIYIRHSEELRGPWFQNG